MTGAGAVHPAVLLVRVLGHALAAVVEGALDAAHAAERVHHRRGRAQARVVAQPPIHGVALLSGLYAGNSAGNMTVIAL